MVDRLRRPDGPTAILALSHGAGRTAMRAVRDAGVTADLAVFDSMGDNDLLVIQGVVLLFSFVYVVVNLIDSVKPSVFI